MSDVFDLPVFPAADVFPMMADDELAELAADIAENGLREPIVVAEVNGETMLIDGRNRRAACEIAAVEPKLRELNGEDPTAFVLSANVHRRNLSAGQRAMAVALIYPTPAKLKRNQKSINGHQEISKQRLADARAVLTYSRELAEAVMRGDKPLQSALAEARQSQGSVRNARARLARLRDERPDLADLVATEAMSLEDALKTASDEAEERKQQRWAATMEVIDGLRPFDRAAETAADNIAFYDAALAESRGETVSPGRLRRAGAYLNALADAMEELQ